MGLRTINHSAAGTSMGVFWPAVLSGERSPDTVPIAFSTEFFRLTCGSNHGQSAQLGSGSQKPTFSIVSRSKGIVTAGDGWKVATLVLGLRRSQKDRLDEICRVLIDGWIPMLGKDVEHVFRWFWNSMEPEGRLVGIT
jgi:hypothetical protein